MGLAIFPPLGFARIGNSPDEFFVGPESRGSMGIEIRSDGEEQPVKTFKDAQFRMKKQGARFHLYEVPEDGGVPIPATLPEGSQVQWSVTLGNKKDAVVRPVRPPGTPRKVQMDPARSDRHIFADANADPNAPVQLDGRYRGTAVNLGNIRMDSQGKLIVLGGRGDSRSPSNAQIGNSFYNNPDWFDDLADGPVRAKILVPGSDPVCAAAAWVVIGPPDFAPVSQGVVTLYDLIFQSAVDVGWVSSIVRPYFETDIRPLIERASNLQWVHGNRVWPQISTDWPKLADSRASFQSLRQQTLGLIGRCEYILQQFELMDWQLEMLEAWVSGSFEAGWAPDRGSAYELTRSALDGTVGAGLYPGIEAGVNLSDAGLFQSSPFEFRLDPNALEAGDLTAHMALPWQADFLKCRLGWWPAQRPNHAPQETGPEKEWLRPDMTHRELVDDVMKLGVITDTPSGEIAEQGRDPVLGD